jgi:hypothetical protein
MVAGRAAILSRTTDDLSCRVDRRSRVVAFLLLATAGWPAKRACATPRPRFEPTDLEWEETGIAELDLKIGPGRGQGPWRLALPDFELAGQAEAIVVIQVELQVEADLDAYRSPGTHFTSSDPDQLQATLGFVWSVRPTLDLSLTGLVGSLSGGDRYGLLFGISPKVRLFK